MQRADLQPDVLWSVAEDLADVAASVTLSHFRSRMLRAESKSVEFDPVTIADRDAEAAMRARLLDLRPEDGILGEEHDDVKGSTGLTWVIDPIDGTRGFISGTPTWGTLIALQDGSGPVLGLIDQPYTGERFAGGLGRSDWRGPHGRGDLEARRGRTLDEATLFTTFPEIGTPDERRGFERVAGEVKLVRYGMDCYAYALLAIGQIDLVIEAGLEAYDIAAPVAVVEAAGGIVTDWEGQPVHGGGRAVAAATPDLHAAALARLNAIG